MNLCPKCGNPGDRTGMGMEVSDRQVHGDAYLCDLEFVACPGCGNWWTLVVRECRQWRKASARAGRRVPYPFHLPEDGAHATA